MKTKLFKDFIKTIAEANNVISNTVFDHVDAVHLRGCADGIINYGFLIKKQYANTIIEFLSDNNVFIPVDSELNGFIQRLRTTDDSAPYLGLDCTRSLEGPVIFVGCRTNHQNNWFVNDYDFALHLPANTDIRDAAEWFKLGYNLEQERFTSIKLYSANTDIVGHHTFMIDANNDLTLVAKRFCEHGELFFGSDASDPVMSKKWLDTAPERWTNKAQDVLNIVNKYNGDERLRLFWRTTERTPNSEGEWGQDEGGLSISAFYTEISPEPEPDVDDDINNPYRYITQPHDNEWLSLANTANTHVE